MQIKLEQLSTQLTTILPVYLIINQEPILTQEAKTCIISGASKIGFNQRTSHWIENQTSWDDITITTQTRSLFTEKKLTTIYIEQTRYLQKKHADQLNMILSNLSNDDCLLIITPKLDAAQQKSSWYKTINKLGGIINTLPLPVFKLTPWVTQRAKQHGFTLDSQAMKTLIDRSNGSMSVIAQYIKQLQLIYQPGHLNKDRILQLINIQPEQQVYLIINTALAGYTTQLAGILQQETSIELQQKLLWSTLKELRSLVNLSSITKNKQSITSLMAQEKIWPSKQKLYQQTLNRLKHRQLEAIYLQGCQLEESIKGLDNKILTHNISQILLTICGHKPCQQT